MTGSNVTSTPPDKHFWDLSIYDWLDIGAKGAGTWLAGFAIEQLLGDPEFSKIQNAIEAAVKEIEDYIATAFLQDALRRATVELNSVILGLNPYSDPKKPISRAGLTDVETARRDAEYAIADSQSLGIPGLAIFANCISYHLISCSMIYKYSSENTRKDEIVRKAKDLNRLACDHLNSKIADFILSLDPNRRVQVPAIACVSTSDDDSVGDCWLILDGVKTQVIRGGLPSNDQWNNLVAEAKADYQDMKDDAISGIVASLQSAMNSWSKNPLLTGVRSRITLHDIRKSISERVKDWR